VSLPDLHRLVALEAGAPWCSFDRRFNLNVLAIRSDSPDNSNLFDDALAVTYHDGVVARTRLMPVTTDPGRPYRATPMRPEGCAVLAPQYAHLSHGLGTHKGRPALVQVGPLKVWRVPAGVSLDRTVEPIEAPRTACINIHDGPGDAASGQVGRWSAGCIVTRRLHDLEALLSLVRAQATSGLGDRVSLLLVDVRDIPRARTLLDTAHGRPTPIGA
jgi:hypothetical protein